MAGLFVFKDGFDRKPERSNRLVAGPEWRHEEATRTAPQAGRTPRTQEMRRT